MSNVTYAKAKVGGALSTALCSSTLTLPTDAKTTLTGFTSLGYISEDGLTNSDSKTKEFIKAWGGDEVLHYVSEKNDTFKCKLIEAYNVDVLKVIHGTDNVSGDLTSGIDVASKEADEERAYVVDMVMKGGIAKRIVIPKGIITEVSEISYKDNDAVGYEIKIRAMADSNGATHYEYIEK